MLDVDLNLNIMIKKLVYIILIASHREWKMGPQKEERLRTVLLLVSMRANSLASGMIGPALMLFTIFVKEVSE